MNNLLYQIELVLENSDEEKERWMYWGFDGHEKDIAQKFYDTLLAGYTNQEEEPVVIYLYELEVDSSTRVVRQSLISAYRMGDEENPSQLSESKGFEFKLVE